jgi:hypothetical protein
MTLFECEKCFGLHPFAWGVEVCKNGCERYRDVDEYARKHKLDPEDIEVRPASDAIDPRGESHDDA